MGGNSSRIKHSSTIGCFPSFSSVSSEAYGAPIHQSQSYSSFKKGKPGAPESRPTIIELTPSSLTLAWKFPPTRGRSQVYAYTIECITNKNHSWSTITSSCQATCYTFTNLQPTLTYSFRVRAENVHGIGKPSLPSQPVCLNHAIKNNSRISLSSRTRSLDASMRNSVRPVLDQMKLNGTFSREWRSMSLRNEHKIHPGSAIDSRVRPSMRPKLPQSMYNCPSDNSFDNVHPIKPTVRCHDDDVIANDLMESCTSRSADDILNNSDCEKITQSFLDNSFMRTHKIKPNYQSCYRESKGEIDMGFLDEINDLDLALRRSCDAHPPRMKNSHTSPDIMTQSITQEPHLNHDMIYNPITDDHDMTYNPITDHDLIYNPITDHDMTYTRVSDQFRHSIYPDSTTVLTSNETLTFDDFTNDNQHSQNVCELPGLVLKVGSAEALVDQIWNEVSIKATSNDHTPRIISNTLTCDWESISDTVSERTLDWRNGSEESLTKCLEDASEVESNYEFD